MWVGPFLRKALQQAAYPSAQRLSGIVELHAVANV